MKNTSKVCYDIPEDIPIKGAIPAYILDSPYNDIEVYKIHNEYEKWDIFQSPIIYDKKLESRYKEITHAYRANSSVHRSNYIAYDIDISSMIEDTTVKDSTSMLVSGYLNSTASEFTIPYEKTGTIINEISKFLFNFDQVQDIDVLSSSFHTTANSAIVDIRLHIYAKLDSVYNTEKMYNQAPYICPGFLSSITHSGRVRMRVSKKYNWDRCMITTPVLLCQFKKEDKEIVTYNAVHRLVNLVRKYQGNINSLKKIL
tara:strand:+ start:539 stop:1309 length:771 start_codon:yes stop_codon:yes gene_type:complete